MSNKAAARHLLESGLTGVRGVVYLDEMDRQMVLLRKGMITRFPTLMSLPSPPALCRHFLLFLTSPHVVFTFLLLKLSASPLLLSPSIDRMTN